MSPRQSDSNSSGFLELLYKTSARLAKLSGEVNFEDRARSVLPTSLTELTQVLQGDIVKVLGNIEHLKENTNTVNGEFDFDVRSEKDSFRVPSNSLRVIERSSHVQAKGLTEGYDSLCPNTIWKYAFSLVK
jgi:hypothetical protein